MEKEPLKQTDKAAYKEGKEAHRKGTPISANPYKSPSDNHKAWHMGYSSAQFSINDKAVDLYADAEKTLAHLYARWQDEKEYEDIKDYQIPLNKYLDSAGASSIRMNKSPFGFTCTIEGDKYRYTMTSRTYSFKKL